MEAIWGACLTLALCRRETRPFAALLLAKWAINYATFFWVGPWVHMAVDLITGTVLVVWAGSSPLRPWKDVIGAATVGTMIAHAWLASAWAVEPGAGQVHYAAVTALFTAQAAALTLPYGGDIVRGTRRWLRDHHRLGSRVAGLVGDHQPGWRRRSKD